MSADPSTTVFPVTPAKSAVFNILAALAGLMILSAGVMAYFAHRGATGLYAAAIIEFLAGLLIVYLARESRRTVVELTASTLRIGGTMFGKTILRSELVVQDARLADLTVETELAPRWKLWGVGMPGYQAGWFSLRNGDKALLFLTDKSHAIHVPTRNGYSILLNVVDPANFLRALKR